MKEPTLLVQSNFTETNNGHFLQNTTSCITVERMPTERVHETDRCDLPLEASRRTDPDPRERR
jgi:hypothetical protein